MSSGDADSSGSGSGHAGRGGARAATGATSLPASLRALSDGLEALGGGDTRASQTHVTVRLVRHPERSVDDDFDADDVVAMGTKAPGASSVSDDTAVQRVVLHGGDRGEQGYTVSNVLPAPSREYVPSVSDALARPVGEWLFDGFNATVVMVGASGAGKSTALFGSGITGDGDGLAGALLDDLFARVAASPNASEFTVAVSAWELRAAGVSAGRGSGRSGGRGGQGSGEEVVDLLAPGMDGGATEASSALRFAAVGVPLTREAAESSGAADRGHAVDFARRMLFRVARSRSVNWRPRLSGSGDRTYVPARNRAHAFIRILVHDGAAQRVSTLHLVDLIGSEPMPVPADRAADVSDALTERERAAVTRQLGALETVITDLARDNATSRDGRSSGTEEGLAAAASGSRSVHARETRLTQILAPLLAGNNKTFVAAFASTRRAQRPRTAATLRLASRARAITCACVRLVGVALSDLAIVPASMVVEESPVGAGSPGAAGRRDDEAEDDAAGGYEYGDDDRDRSVDSAGAGAGAGGGGGGGIDGGDGSIDLNDTELDGAATAERSMRWLDEFMRRKADILASSGTEGAGAGGGGGDDGGGGGGGRDSPLRDDETPPDLDGLRTQIHTTVHDILSDRNEAGTRGAGGSYAQRHAAGRSVSDDRDDYEDDGFDDDDDDDDDGDDGGDDGAHGGATGAAGGRDSLSMLAEDQGRGEGHGQGSRRGGDSGGRAPRAASNPASPPAPPHAASGGRDARGGVVPAPALPAPGTSGSWPSQGGAPIAPMSAGSAPGGRYVAHTPAPGPVYGGGAAYGHPQQQLQQLQQQQQHQHLAARQQQVAMSAPPAGAGYGAMVSPMPPTPGLPAHIAGAGMTPMTRPAVGATSMPATLPPAPASPPPESREPLDASSSPSAVSAVVAREEATLLRKNYDSLVALLRDEQTAKAKLADWAAELEQRLAETTTTYELQLDDAREESRELRRTCHALASKHGFADVFDNSEAAIAKLTAEVAQLRQDNVRLEIAIADQQQELDAASASVAAAGLGFGRRVGGGGGGGGGGAAAAASAGGSGASDGDGADGDGGGDTATVTTAASPKAASGRSAALGRLRKRVRTAAAESDELRTALAAAEKRERVHALNKRCLEDALRRINRLDRENEAAKEELQMRRLQAAELEARADTAEAAEKAVREREAALLEEREATSEEIAAMRRYVSGVNKDRKRRHVLGVVRHTKSASPGASTQTLTDNLREGIAAVEAGGAVRTGGSGSDAASRRAEDARQRAFGLLSKLETECRQSEPRLVPTVAKLHSDVKTLDDARVEGLARENDLVDALSELIQGRAEPSDARIVKRLAGDGATAAAHPGGRRTSGGGASSGAAGGSVASTPGGSKRGGSIGGAGVPYRTAGSSASSGAGSVDSGRAGGRVASEAGVGIAFGARGAAAGGSSSSGGTTKRAVKGKTRKSKSRSKSPPKAAAAAAARRSGSRSPYYGR